MPIVIHDIDVPPLIMSFIAPPIDAPAGLIQQRLEIYLQIQPLLSRWTACLKAQALVPI